MSTLHLAKLDLQIICLSHQFYSDKLSIKYDIKSAFDESLWHVKSW